jgi:hypothetical protein
MERSVKTFAGVAVLCAVLAGVTLRQTREIDAAEYRALRSGFKQGTLGYRAAVAAAMQSGAISRWEYRRLLDRYWNETSAYALDKSVVNLREERLVLAAMTRQVRSP